jgi:curved DNA-binding protein
MRLKGRGMPGKPDGDLLVEIQIHTPPADDDDSKAYYRDMQEKFDFNPRKF